MMEKKTNRNLMALLNSLTDNAVGNLKSTEITELTLPMAFARLEVSDSINSYNIAVREWNKLKKIVELIDKELKWVATQVNMAETGKAFVRNLKKNKK